MIASPYPPTAPLGAALTITAILFERGLLDASSQTVCWSVIFFFASAAASAAYLTVSEIFPLEVRAFAIALCFMLDTATGGIAAPSVRHADRDRGPGRDRLGLLPRRNPDARRRPDAWLIGVDAERKPLEAVATPLSSAAHPSQGAEAPAAG